MSDGAVNHDYHLVKPSPWPIMTSIGILLLAVGGVIFMKGLFGLPKGTPWVALTGFAWICIVLVGWWGDVIKEGRVGDHTEVVQISLRYGMVLFIASEVMFFVAWFWDFFEMAIFHTARAGHTFDATNPDLDKLPMWKQWPPPQVDGSRVKTFDPFHLPLINTLVLLLSGTTVTWAHHALQVGNRRSAILGLFFTIVLGLSFTAFQAMEYSEAGFSYSGSLYGSAFFMATGFHGAHVIIGTIFLTVCMFRLMAGGMSAKKHLGFEFAAWYWHFVDVVWLFLFAFVYVTPRLVLGG